MQVMFDSLRRRLSEWWYFNDSVIAALVGIVTFKIRGLVYENKRI